MAINIKFEGKDIRIPGGTHVRKVFLPSKEQMDSNTEQIAKLVAALEAGTYNAIKDVSSKLDLSTATGAELDKIGEMWGLKRKDAVDPMYGNKSVESDRDYKHRIRSTALDDGIGVPFQFDEDIEKLELESVGILPTGPKCECGAAALGYNQPGPGHAHWCPIATK
jgi:uncharacterized phage protein gp47/JayE